MSGAEDIRPLREWRPGTRVMIPLAYGGGTHPCEVVRHNSSTDQTMLRDSEGGHERETWSGHGFVTVAAYKAVKERQ